MVRACQQAIASGWLRKGIEVVATEAPARRPADEDDDRER
jgi:hypothetical protein